ncbi:MAG: hypothetical protein NC131_19425 [Roseburia sp.]|nr:hypothetical protein [Roseburia sp.]
MKDAITPDTVGGLLQDILGVADRKLSAPIEVSSTEKMLSMINRGECIEGQVYFTTEED